MAHPSPQIRDFHSSRPARPHDTTAAIHSGVKRVFAGAPPFAVFAKGGKLLCSTTDYAGKSARRSHTPRSDGCGITAAVDKKELPPMEPGAMSYMLSKQSYLGDGNGHWHPHLMFFVSQGDPAAWGAGLPGSPILDFNITSEHLVVYLVPVREWSDGSPDQ